MINLEDLKNLIAIPQNPVSLTELVSRIVSLLALIAGIVALFAIIYSGFLYITAGSSPDQAKKAQAAFINVIIGVIIVSFSYLAVRLLGTLVLTVFK